MRSLVLLGLFSLPLIADTGCVHIESSGTTNTYAFHFWIPLVTILGGVFAAIAGWFVRYLSSRIGWSLLILGPVLGIGMSPGFLRDRVIVSDESISVRVGEFGFAKERVVRYDDLFSARIVSEEGRGRRGRKTVNYYLICERKDNTSEKFTLENKVVFEAAVDFLGRASEKGITVDNETGF